MRIDVRPPNDPAAHRTKVPAGPQVTTRAPYAYATLLAAVGAALPADSPDAEGWTQILLDRINGPELNLRCLPQGAQGLLARLPPAAWQALDQYALAKHGVPVGTVLSDGPPSAGEVAGLKELAALRCVAVLAPQGMRECVDLTGLPLPGGGLQVNIDGEIAAELKVMVPAGAKVLATLETGAVLHSAQVFEVQDDGSVDLDHPLPLQGPTPGASDPASRRQAARAELVAALHDSMPLNAAIETAAWLFARIDGETLDVSDANGQQIALLKSLSPRALAALQECATAFGATEGITTIKAAADLCTTDAFARSVQQLTHLKTFKIVLPEGEGADRRMDLHAPADAAVTGESQGPRVHKLRVHLVDAQGVEQAKPGALHGVIYDHTARAEDFPEGVDPAKLQQTAHELNVNGASHQMAYDPQSGLYRPVATVCRHLSVMWLRMRQQYQEMKSQKLRNAQRGGAQPADKRPFSFKNFTSIAATQESMLAGVGPGRFTEQAYKDMLDAGAKSIFSSDAFGTMVADELSMLEPGQSKQFGVGTSNHMLSLDIRVKERLVRGRVQREYVVNLYDPNRTVTHQRLVVRDLAQLRAMNLSKWLGPRLMRAYFSNGDEAIGSLYAWPPAKARPKDHAPRLYVSPAQQASGPMLFQAFNTGEPALVRQAIRALRDRLPPLTEDKLIVALHGRGWDDNLPGWMGGPQAWRPAMLTAHFEEILNFPDHLLPRALKLQLLRPMEAQGSRLRVSLETGDVACTQALLDAVLQAPLQALSSRERVQLLLTNAPGSRGFRDIWTYTPFQRGSTEPWPPWHHEHLQAAKLFLTTVLSSEMLSPADKDRLCFSSEGLGASPVAAAAACKARNHFAVSALLCGILNSTATPELKAQWIKRSGLDLVWLIDTLTRHAISVSGTDVAPARGSRADLVNACVKNQNLFGDDPEVSKRLKAHVAGTWDRR